MIFIRKLSKKKINLLYIILSLIYFCSIVTTSFAETATTTHAETDTTINISEETPTTAPVETPTLTATPAEITTTVITPTKIPTATTAPAETTTVATPPQVAIEEIDPENTETATKPDIISVPYLTPLVSLPTMSALTGNPGDIFLRKTANQIPVACRTYNVTVGVSGNPIPGVGNVDVVIVIDNSLSMSQDLNASANIAKQLVFLLNDNTGNQVGIVSFNALATKHQVNGSYFSSKKTDWNSTINGLNSSGASNIATGITAAHEILRTSNRYGNPNVSQSIIVLSDGIASTTIAGNTNDAYVASDYNTAYNNAVTSARSTAADDMKILGINLSETTSSSEKPYGVQMMTALGVDGYINIQTYSGDAKVDGQLIYDAISKSIYATATNGILTDTIDPRFEFVSFISYSGLVPPTISTIGTKQVISWNIGAVTLVEKTVTYSLRAKLGVQGIVPTNESAKLTFTPATGSAESSPKFFTVPDVYVAPPLAVSITDVLVVIGTPLTIGSATNPLGGNYMTVTGGWYVNSVVMALYPGRFPNTIPQVLNYQWYLASDTNMTTPINPTVTPNIDTQYRVKVTDAYGCTTTATMWVKPRGSLTVSKTVQNLQSKDVNREFYIWVFGPNGNAWTVTLKNGESKTITGLVSGKYTISETPPMNFQLVGISFPSLTISTSAPYLTTMVTNKRVTNGWFDDQEKVVNSFAANTVFQ